MADTSTIVVLEQTDPLVADSSDGKELLKKVANYLHGAINGAKRLKSVQVIPDGTAPLPAVAHINLATCLADTVIEINGAPFTAIAGTVVTTNDEFDIDGADAADAADLARAINASTHTSIYKLVKAVNPLKDVLTASTAIAGTKFTVTLADGTVHTFIGKAGSATSGGLNFSIDTGNTETATSIAAQVNGYAPFANKLAASSSAAVVTFHSLDGNNFTLVGTATKLAESGGARVTVSAYQKGALGNTLQVRTLGVAAKAIITPAAIEANDTVTLNGQAFTATQQRATGTLTAATAIAGDTFSIGGNTFTGVAGAVTLGEKTFSVDTGDTECAASIAAQINAFTPLSGVVTATSASGVVTIRAVTAGTAGNAILLSGTATTLEASAATLEDGVAVANNAFEVVGTNAQVGTDLVRAINASTTALVNRAVRATCSAAGVVTVWSKVPGLAGNSITVATSNATRLGITGSLARLAGGTDTSAYGAAASATVTCASVNNADTVTINGVVFTAHTNTDAANQFAIDGDDTADGDKLVRAINNSTSAGAKEVFAANTAGAVLISARRTGFQGNNITIATSNGSRLAITGDASGRLASGALPTTVVITNNDSLSRTNGATTASGGTGGNATATTITL